GLVLANNRHGFAQVLGTTKGMLGGPPVMPALLDGRQECVRLQPGQEVDPAASPLQGIGICQALIKRFIPLRGGGVAADKDRKLAHSAQSCRKGGTMSSFLASGRTFPCPARSAPEQKTSQINSGSGRLG